MKGGDPEANEPAEAARATPGGGLRGWLARVAMRMGLAVVTLVLALGAIEVALRVAPIRETDPAADRSHCYYRVAPERTHPWSAGATNVLRIAVIGDSFTHGVGVQQDERYGAQMERMLNLNAGVRPVEVKVLANPGTSTFQQVPILHKALEYRPQVVILGICLNDAEDWTNPKQMNEWLQKWIFLASSTPGPRWQTVLNHSRLASRIFQAMLAARSQSGARAYYRRLYDPRYSGLERMSGAIRDFRDACASNGVAFVPVVFPLLSSDLTPGRYPFQFAHDRVREIMATNHVEYLDLLPAFLGTSSQRMQAVPGIDPHPSEIAHRVAAETIVWELVRRKLIDEALTPRVAFAEKNRCRLWHRKINRYNPTAPKKPARHR